MNNDILVNNNEYWIFGKKYNTLADYIIESRQIPWITYVVNFPPILNTDITNDVGLNYIHKELEYNDYDKEVLLPHKLSQEGPFFDVADVNNDGLDDFFVGNGSGFAGQLFIQTSNGKFNSTNNAVFENEFDSK